MKNTSKNNSLEDTFLETTDWSEINWFKVKKQTDKLERRISKAGKKNKFHQLGSLQRMLIYRKTTLLLAIKKITQINKDKITLDIDGFIALGDKELGELFDTMKTMNIKLHNPKPAYHKHITNKNGKLRSLGMPTIKDWIYQEITRRALELQAELKFEPSIYGFRPHRNRHMALNEIMKNTVSGNWTWVFKGDFKTCFDGISHDFILKQVDKFQLYKLIEKFLKAGYLDNNVFQSLSDGTPQGGPLPPLLANIALNGMEEALGIIHNKTEDGIVSYETKNKYHMIRYTDEFVIFAKSKEDIEAIPDILSSYLEERGLKLPENKVSIANISDGFDFRGRNFKK